MADIEKTIIDQIELLDSVQPSSFNFDIGESISPSGATPSGMQVGIDEIMPAPDSSGYTQEGSVFLFNSNILIPSSSGYSIQGEPQSVSSEISTISASGYLFSQSNLEFNEDIVYINHADDSGDIITDELPSKRTLSLSVNATKFVSPRFDMIGPKGSYLGRVPIQMELYGSVASDFSYDHYLFPSYCDSSSSDNEQVAGPSGILRTMWWDALDDIYSSKTSRLRIDRDNGGRQKDSESFTIDPDIPATMIPYMDMNDSFTFPASGVPVEFKYAAVNTSLYPVREAKVCTSQYFNETDAYEIVTFSEQNTLEIFQGVLTLRNNGTLYEPNFESSGTFTESYDLGEDKDIRSISWTGGLADGTSVSFRIRGVSESAGYSALTCQEWKSDAKHLHICRYVEIEVTLSTSVPTNQYEEVVLSTGYLSQNDLNSWNSSQLIDGDDQTTGFHTDSADAGAWMQIDFGAGNEKDLTKWEYYLSGPSNCIWNIQYSDDGSTWYDAYTDWNVSGLSYWHEATWDSVGPYRYWRTYKTSSASGGGWHWELKVSETSLAGQSPYIRKVSIDTRTDQYDYALPSGWQALQPNSKVYKNYNDWYYTAGPSGVTTDIIDAGRDVDWGKYYAIKTTILDSGISDPGLIMHIPATGSAAGTTFTDVGPLSQTVLTSGSPTTELDTDAFGRTDGVMNIDANGEHIYVSDATNGALGPGDDFTVRFLVYQEPSFGYQPYFSIDSQSNFIIKRASGGNNQNLYAYDSENSTFSVITCTIPDNTWVEIAFVKSSQTAYIFKDGVLQGSMSGYDSDCTGTNFRWGNGQQGVEYFNGKLQEMSFWNYAKWTSNYTPLSKPLSEYPQGEDVDISFRAADTEVNLESKDWVTPSGYNIFPSPSGNRFLQWAAPSGVQVDNLIITFYDDKKWLPWELPYASGVFTGGAFDDDGVVKLGQVVESSVTSGMLSQNNLNSWNAAQLIDDNTGTTGFHTDSAGVGAWMKIDFGAANEKALVKWRYFLSGPNSCTWDIQYSDDDSNWTNAYTGWNVSGLSFWHEVEWENVGSHRYWRTYKTSSAAGGGWHWELEVFEQDITSGSYSDVIDFNEDKEFAYIAADTRTVEGTSATLEYKISTESEGQGALSGKSWSEYDYQAGLIGASGRYMEMKVSLSNPSSISPYPEVRDVVIGWLPNADIHTFQYPSASGQVWPSGYQGQLNLGIKGRTDLESRRSGDLTISNDFVILDSDIQVTDVAPIFQWDNVNDPDVPRQDVTYEFQVVTADDLDEFTESTIHDIDLSVYESKDSEVTTNVGEVFISPSGSSFSSSVTYKIDATEQRIWNNFYSRSDFSLGIYGTQVFYKVRFSEDDSTWTDWKQVSSNQKILERGRYAEVLIEFEYFSGVLKYPIREISLTSTPGERAFIIPENSGSTTSFDYFDVGTLANDVHNYYRVRAFDGSGFTHWSRVFAVFPSAAGAPLAPSGLLAEGLVAPNRLVTFNPYLSWTFEDYAQEDDQAHARIQVGSNPGTYDVWDSGKLPTASGVEYGATSPDTRVGPIPLVRGRTYHWRVRAWDDSVDNLGGPFSQESTMQMNQLPTAPISLSPEDC